MESIIKTQWLRPCLIALSLLSALLSGASFTTAQAAPYSLSPNPFLYSCPFYHADQAQFDSLMETAKSQLQAKIHGNQACAGSLSQVISQLDTISRSFQNVDPSMQQRITAEFMSKYLIDLQAQKSQLEASGQTSSADYSTVVDTISSIQTELVDNHISGIYNSEYAAAEKNNSFRQGMFDTMNQLIISLKNTDPRCLSSMGGWSTVFPAVLSVSSMASGFSGFAAQPVLSSALTLAANIADLLRDRDAKNALSRIQDFQNDQVLECTYYSMKYAACELQRSFRLSEDTATITRLIKEKYSSGIQGEWEKLYHFIDALPDFKSVYSSVASMGSPLTLDSSILTAYISALQLDPYNIPPAPDKNASDAEKQQWLTDVQARGLTISTTDLTGGTKSLDQQIADASTKIQNSKATIDTVIQILQKNQSFYDLRAELNRNNPHFLKDVTDLNSFLQRYVDYAQSADNDDEVLREGAGDIAIIQKVLHHLKEFLSVSLNDSTKQQYCDLPTAPRPKENCLRNVSQQDAYIGLVNDRGFSFFNAMTEGTVAQVSKQSILTVAAKISDRQSRALQIIVNYYVDRELQERKRDPESPVPSFTDYIRDRSLLGQIVENYASFQGTGQTNRVETVNATLHTFEDGFEDEILDAIDTAMSGTSDILPELNGRTGAHLCSLFADMLQRKSNDGGFFGDSRARRILNQCYSRYKYLDLIQFPSDSGQGNLTGPKQLPINWTDPCFYPNYNRNFEMQSFILDQIRQNGDQLSE